MSAKCSVCEESLGAPRVIVVTARNLLAMIAPPVFMHLNCFRQTIEPGLVFMWPVRINTRDEPQAPFDLRPVLKIGKLEAWEDGKPAEPLSWGMAFDEALNEALEFVHRRPEGERRDKLERMLHERVHAFSSLLNGGDVTCF